MSEQFKIFLSQLSETNATLDYFTDFKKIKSNINKIAIKLNQLNYLIGKENLKEAVNELFEENPKVFGRFGVINPKFYPIVNKDNCQKKEFQLDPLLGYTE